MSTELEAVAHVMSQTHLSKTKLDLPHVSTDDLEREFCALNQSDSSGCADENQEDESVWRKRRAKVKQRLATRNKKVAELLETTPPSPARQVKCLRDLISAATKCQQKTTRLDDPTLQMLERSLSESYREAQSQEWFISNVVQQPNNSSLPCDLLNVLMKWTSSGANTRLLQKLSALICRFCSAPAFCRSILFTHVIVELIDNIVLLLKNTERDADQLLCLIHVLLSAVNSAKNTAGWKVFKIDERELEIRLSMISGYLLACRWSTLLECVITPDVPTELFSKLSSLHTELAGVISDDT
ncbi:hypothetical protein OESDEN_21347 [Oesophagostomum dentatum]|uniref:Uncharacterized protein n=1 Tax=Oesophagostomum dentatum TaxID=61180 RepID=A0A0B1S6A3_OESDE|nr:hypothetical protein OESDEN_21347 [Oesophagostomum dentatum]